MKVRYLLYIFISLISFNIFAQNTNLAIYMFSIDSSLTNQSFNIGVGPGNDVASYLQCDNESFIISPANYTGQTNCYVVRNPGFSDKIYTTLNSYSQNAQSKQLATCNAPYLYDPHNPSSVQHHFFIVSQDSHGNVLCKMIN